MSSLTFQLIRFPQLSQGGDTRRLHRSVKQITIRANFLMRIQRFQGPRAARLFFHLTLTGPTTGRPEWID
ncbi:MAG: hypothetical protein VYC80_09525, partial [Planctomycetota bacterium]|nr:hypothetical protein [Planctomycetota bacterium]